MSNNTYFHYDPAYITKENRKHIIEFYLSRHNETSDPITVDEIDIACKGILPSGMISYYNTYYEKN